MITEKFRKALKFVLKWEGGLSDDPDDPGGRTYKGVTQARYNQYRKSKKLPVQDVAKMSDAEMEEIYYEYYWQPVWGDKLPSPLDLVVFDTAVNMGVKTAISLLQRALNSLLPKNEQVSVDGKIGEQTLNAIAKVSQKHGLRALCNAMLSLRKERYHNIAKANPKLKKFLKGWLNRVADLEKTIAG